jgi:TRAP-type C4-dicarboxylate transport system permease small subunit
MKKILAYVDANGERWMLLTLYGYIVTVVFVEVIRRFVLQYSSYWGEETARYAFIYLVWIGAAAAVKDRAHLRIDVIFNVLPSRWIVYVYLIGDCLTVVFACFALYWSLGNLGVTIKFDALTHGLRISQAWFIFAVPFGFSLILIRLVQSIREDVANIIAGRAMRSGRSLFG